MHIPHRVLNIFALQIALVFIYVVTGFVESFAGWSLAPFRVTILTIVVLLTFVQFAANPLVLLTRYWFTDLAQIGMVTKGYPYVRVNGRRPHYKLDSVTSDPIIRPLGETLAYFLTDPPARVRPYPRWLTKIGYYNSSKLMADKVSSFLPRSSDMLPIKYADRNIYRHDEYHVRLLAFHSIRVANEIMTENSMVDTDTPWALASYVAASADGYRDLVNEVKVARIKARVIPLWEAQVHPSRVFLTRKMDIEVLSGYLNLPYEWFDEALSDQYDIGEGTQKIVREW